VKTQAHTTLTRGGRAFRLGGAVLLALLPLVSASARIHHNDSWARQQFAQAERAREALNGRPMGERTRREYQRAIDSYRRVYFGSPASSKADPSVVATAELMVEMGRRFGDNKILRSAVEQYRFLRKEYPGSKYRFDALFTIGEIYKDDLNDPEESRTVFQDFLHRYPRNRLADDARSAIKEIDADAAEMEHSAQKTARKQRSSGGAKGNADRGDQDETANGSNGAASGAPAVSNASNDRRSELPRVTGVRHWSTPDYTRVAIDVEQEVKFGSQRISHPDRIFFDLRDTRLASTLVGKTFDVDDGFLKKIRVAEFEPGRTRIVLEVDDLASYDAFLLPDPYRLIIDIHGKQNRGTPVARNRASSGRPSTGQNASTARSSEVEEAMVPEPSSGGDVKSALQRVLRKPEKDKDADSSKDNDKDKDFVVYPKNGPVETDLPAGNARADSRPSSFAKPANGNGVTKTTVAVKGSDRRIPKTIVDADGDTNSDTKGANENADADIDRKPVAKKRGSATVAAADRADSGPSRSESASLTVAPSRKKSRSSGGASDTRDLSAESREARPTASGDRSLTRALGLKIGKIVIDAGHGGHDTGTIGPNGLFEKDVVLDVAKRLGRLLESRLGAEVIYTRQDDTFIPLETRTAIANRERADLFISIHANSSRDSDARGVETYYLNFTSSPEALEVAARENAVSEKSIHELQDLVKKIAMKEKIDESREFAGDVQESLYGGLALSNAGVRDRGIKKAPFIVLIGANMPSILAEISFVSNPTDERKMETSEHRQRIAESLYRGVSKYCNGLSGVKVASKIDKPEGQ
jgi:N-acetylmuramoyl-L-alanine amidase